MEQITLVFLIGAFILFLCQFIWKKERVLQYMGFFTSVSVVILSLMDDDLATAVDSLAVMITMGFALVLYSVTRLFKA